MRLIDAGTSYQLILQEFRNILTLTHVPLADRARDHGYSRTMNKRKTDSLKTDTHKSAGVVQTGDKSARQRIVEAAQELLALRPPEMIVNREISDLAGTRQSLIYYYFDSQEALFKEAMTQLTDAYIEQRRKSVDRSQKFPTLPISDHELWWKAAANFSGDSGLAYGRLRWGYPVVTFELQEILSHHPDLDPLEVKAHILREICFNFGWVRYKNTVALGLGVSGEDLKKIECKIYSGT